MACLTENQIVEFFSAHRSPEIAAGVDAHASGCERCRLLLAEYAQLAIGTSVTHAEHKLDPGLAAVPTLTPTNDATHDRVELVQRLAQAHARKHIGAVLKGKWEIEELIGTGGMAHVFAARHRNGRRVAIKCMRPELMLERTLVERFLREGYVANKIEHPGAVAILDDDVMDDGTPFLVMELLVGRTLRDRLGHGPLALDEALGAVAQVLDLLAAAHDKGIVHRDLKPDNLFETEDGTIKVLDFGIARLKERARPDFETRSGITMGTLGYMSPEQARGLAAQVDARSDVWAMGATLYSLITGRRLHENAETTNEALLLAMTSPVPPMRELIPALPPDVQALLDKSLAFDKERRFPSARAMNEALTLVRLGADDTVVGSNPTAGVAASTPKGPQLVAEAASAIEPALATATMLDRAFARGGVSTPPRGAARTGRRIGLGLAAGVVIAAGVAVSTGLVGPQKLSSSSGSSVSSAPSEPAALSSVPPAPAAPAIPDTSAPSASPSPSDPPAMGSATVVAAKPALSTRTPPKVAGGPTRTSPRPKPANPSPSAVPTVPTANDTRDPLGPQH